MTEALKAFCLSSCSVWVQTLNGGWKWEKIYSLKDNLKPRRYIKQKNGLEINNGTVWN